MTDSICQDDAEPDSPAITLDIDVRAEAWRPFIADLRVHADYLARALGLPCVELSLVLGDDMLGQAMRCVRGIEVDEDALAFEVMQSVCLEGPGHYLGTAETLARMERDYVYPALADRSSPGEWAEKGAPDLVEKAAAKKRAILEGPNPAALPADVEAFVRSRYEILL